MDADEGTFACADARDSTDDVVRLVVAALTLSNGMKKEKEKISQLVVF